MWNSKTKIFGLPLISVGFAAKGIIAIGFSGAGIVTIAQFGVGFFTITQFGIGFVSVSQFCAGFFCVAQFAAGIIFALGQFAVGFIAVGINGALGYYVKSGLINSEGLSAEMAKLFSNNISENPYPLIAWSVLSISAAGFMLNRKIKKYNKNDKN